MHVGLEGIRISQLSCNHLVTCGSQTLRSKLNTTVLPKLFDHYVSGEEKRVRQGEAAVDCQAVVLKPIATLVICSHWLGMFRLLSHYPCINSVFASYFPNEQQCNLFITLFPIELGWSKYMESFVGKIHTNIKL